MRINKSVPVAADLEGVEFYYPTADEMKLWR